MAAPVIRAIFKRDLRRWFGNPTGYVFITLFVLLAAAALYWPDEFFQNNLANLDSLNTWFPWLLLFFVPAVTMSVWAGERGQGTDELLFTLPASDTQIVLGKYLAAAGIYTVALVFCLPLLLFLEYLGNPDWGLLFGNALGFWMFGLLLVAVGMVGSQLSENLTVAFIFGAFFTAIVVLIEPILTALVPELIRPWIGYGPDALFQELGRGVVSPGSIFLFGGMTVGFLYLNLLLLSRRHWRRGRHEGAHLGVRFLALLVATVSLTVLGASLGPRLDTTAERLHSLSPETTHLIEEIDPQRPVAIHAFVSRDVPRDYVQTRRTLLDLLRQYEAIGNGRIVVRLIETEAFSPEAREAEKRFAIHSSEVQSQEGTATRSFTIYLGVACVSGLDEVVIPFLDKGLPVEYELTRSIRTVASTERLKVGMLDNEVKPFGGFEFQTMRQDRQWEIVRELELQYQVERVAPGEDYPADLDVLIALMPSSLTQEELDRLAAYVKGGGKTLLVDDPFPASNPSLAPTEPKGGPRNPFQQAPPAPPKGDVMAFLASIDLHWPTTTIVWDSYNPHPQLGRMEPELVFVGANRKGAQPAFNADQAITSGLQELVTIFGGTVQESNVAGIRFTPLIRTTPGSGVLDLNQIFQRNFLGGRQINPGRRHVPDGREKTLACRVQGKPDGEGAKEIDVIFLADLDLISSEFFELRRRGFANLLFDNVTFVLNCVDDLAGQTSFIELRKRRPRHRTLVKLEEEERKFTEDWQTQKEKAEKQAEERLAAAQKRLDEKVASIESRGDLDERSKEIQIQSVREVEQRRLDGEKAGIEGEKEQAIQLARGDKAQAENKIRGAYRLGALLMSPVPGLVLGIGILLRRRNRERESAQGGRRIGGV